jgi:hypothetical protein
MAYSLEEQLLDQELDKRRRHANVEAQAWWDPLYQKLGTRARAPVEGEDHWQYRADMAVKAKSNLPKTHELARNLQLRKLARDENKTAFRAFERQIHDAFDAYVVSADSAPTGEIREIKEYDQTGTLRSSKFIGQNCFVKAMGRPGRRVLSFNTSNGPVDASGRFLR